MFLFCVRVHEKGWMDEAIDVITMYGIGSQVVTKGKDLAGVGHNQISFSRK